MDSFCAVFIGMVGKRGGIVMGDTPEEKLNKLYDGIKYVLKVVLLVSILFLKGYEPFHAVGIKTEKYCQIDISGETCTATILTRENPRAVALIGHGVSANRGVMNATARAFAHNGFNAVAFDFTGHGSSRDRFDWSSNPARILGMCEWARKTYPGLPLVYVGHSMGAFAGAEAFNEQPVVDAFVSMGALPGKIPECKTLIAAGKYEELFSPEEAREKAGERTEVLITPFSNHALETWDAALLQGIVEWGKTTLGLKGGAVYSWKNTLFPFAAMLLLFLFLFQGVFFPKAPDATSKMPQFLPSGRSWSLNPYRVFGVLLRARGTVRPPAQIPRFRGVIIMAGFSVIVGVLVTMFLVGGRNALFTVDLLSPPRLLTWAVLFGLFLPFVALDVWVLERLPLVSGAKRVAVAVLTRCVPMALLAALLWLAVPGMAFGGMMLGILTFVVFMLTMVYAGILQQTNDWRAGALTVAGLFSWVIAYWFPLAWPWVS